MSLRRLCEPIGRGDARGDQARAGKLEDGLKLRLLVDVGANADQLDRDPALGLAVEGTQGHDAAAVAHRREQGATDVGRVDQAVHAVGNEVADCGGGVRPAGHEGFGAEAADKGLVVRRGDRDHAQPVGDSDLRRVAADSAGGTADRDDVAGGEPERVVREPHREAVHRQRRRLDQAEPVRDSGRRALVDDDELGVRAAAVGDEPRHRGHAVAHLPARVWADSIDDAGELETGDVRRLTGDERAEPTRAEERVGRVHRRGSDPDPDLADAGLRQRQLDEPEHLGPAVASEADRAHERPAPAS